MTRLNMSIGQRLGAALSILLLTAGLVLWQTLKAESDGYPVTIAIPRAPRSQSAPGSSTPVIKNISQLQRWSFSLFRTPPEGLPSRVTEALHTPTHGLNWGLAQRIYSPADADFWAVPGRGVVCIVAQEDLGSASANCAKTRHAVDHGVAAVLLREDRAAMPGVSTGQRTIVGIAPDTTNEIRVHTEDATAVVPASEGVFTLQDTVMKPPDNFSP